MCAGLVCVAGKGAAEGAVFTPLLHGFSSPVSYFAQEEALRRGQSLEDACVRAVMREAEFDCRLTQVCAA